MLLRDHPLMSYRGVPRWPPAWLWRGGNETINPKGEVGILKDVIPPPSSLTTVRLSYGALWR
jgi:hypothetical protein